MNASIELIARTKALSEGDKLSTGERIMVAQDIADELLRRNVRPRDIMDVYGVARTTAMAWLSDAYLLLDKESKMTREGMRNIQRGQVEHMLNKLSIALDKAKDLGDQLAIHDRIIKYMDSRARTHGLNSETVDHTVQLKPMSIHIPREAVEATVIEQPPTTNTDHPNT
jgi:hypothetical protein